MGVSSGLTTEMVWASHQIKAEGETEEETAREKMKGNWKEKRLKSSVPLRAPHFVFIGTGKSACNFPTNSLN